MEDKQEVEQVNEAQEEQEVKTFTEEEVEELVHRRVSEAL